MVPARNMKTSLLSLSTRLILASAVCGIAFADSPKKAPLVKYTGLWTNSPFTSKPPPLPPGEVVNPLDDFTLTGIAPVPGGYRITIINKKNPELKKVIEPGVTGEFKVVSVNRNPEKTLGTTVVLSSGSIQGTVSFEPDLITLKAAPAPQRQPNAKLPPGITPAMAGKKGGTRTNARKPRPRIVPPPTPANKKNNSGRSNKPRR